jgi:elongation factor P
MNVENYEQITLEKKILDAPDLFEEGTNVMVQGLILKPIFIIC